jgi:hypothetical protein
MTIIYQYLDRLDRFSQSTQALPATRRTAPPIGISYGINDAGKILSIMNTRCKKMQKMNEGNA